MAASYPSSAKSFTPLVDNTDYPQATQVNQIYDELTALEQALLSTGLAHDLKFVDATYDIGKSGATRPRDLFTSRNATVGGTVTVTGGQIVFPATQVPSAGANTLDDYEEGTWLPILTNGAGAVAGQTYTNQAGLYVKVGRLVVIGGIITLSAKGSLGAGAVYVENIPFTPAGYGTMHISYFAAMATNWTNLSGYMAPSTPQVPIVGVSAAAAGVSSIGGGDLTNTSYIIFSASYSTT